MHPTVITIQIRTNFKISKFILNVRFLWFCPKLMRLGQLSSVNPVELTCLVLTRRQRQISISLLPFDLVDPRDHEVMSTSIPVTSMATSRAQKNAPTDIVKYGNFKENGSASYTLPELQDCHLKIRITPFNLLNYGPVDTKKSWKIRNSAVQMSSAKRNHCQLWVPLADLQSSVVRTSKCFLLLILLLSFLRSATVLSMCHEWACSQCCELRRFSSHFSWACLWFCWLSPNSGYFWGLRVCCLRACPCCPVLEDQVVWDSDAIPSVPLCLYGSMVWWNGRRGFFAGYVFEM